MQLWVEGEAMRSSATALRAQGQDVEHWLSLSRIVKLGIGTASAETCEREARIYIRDPTQGQCSEFYFPSRNLHVSFKENSLCVF